MTQEQLQQILKRHMHWLQKDCIGWEEMKADLSDADLSNTNLRHADLRYANLNGANLNGANLSGANLSNANLSNAYLSGASLSNAYLSGANRSKAYLSDANLNNVDLRNADLRRANLSNANLSNADLSGVNLNGANLKGANLNSANLNGAENVPYIPMICPEEGDFIGWKKASGKIVKLHILEDALRSSATTRKCRCSKAEVVEIYNLDGTISEQRCVKSDYNNDFVYRVGETVSVDNFDVERWNEYSYGIHFFINRQEAIEYVQ